MFFQYRFNPKNLNSPSDEMQKYVVEMIGTFFLVFTIGNVAIEPGAGDFAPIAIGAILMVLVFAGGHISGAHYNPAVTLAALLRGKFPAKDLVPYVVFQIAGAVAASAAVLFLKGSVDVEAKDLTPLIPQALFAEFLATFALAYVVLNVATAKGTDGNSFYGVAIGFTVLASAYAVGGITGGAFNPAVAVGISIMGLSTWGSLWIFLAANFSGAAVAAFVFRFVNGDE